MVPRYARFSKVLAVGVVAVTGLMLTGCGSDEPSTADCRVVSPGADGTTVVEVAARSMAFDFECIEVEPGPVSFVFTNEDSGVPHNLRVRGHGINEATDLESGPSEHILELDLARMGEYQVRCDPHPSMKATVVVAEAGAALPSS